MSPLDKIAQENSLSLGIVFPLESYDGSVPEMKDQEALAKYAEEAGFKALWFRDVPLHDPSFGDAGQMYDPFVYMAHIMNHTSEIALATGSIILPLRHPIHTLKAINSLQSLSDGRIIIGTASGDRPIEFPAFQQEHPNRAQLFRESFQYMQALNDSFPIHKSENYGSLLGNTDLLPKTNHTTPYLVTGHAGQTLDWIAEHADAWLYYPRNMYILEATMEDWTAALERQSQPWKPYMQSLYIDLVKEKNEEPTPIHLGFRSSVNYLLQHLRAIRKVGVNHVIINLKFSSLPIKQTIDMLSENVIAQLD